MAAAVPGAQYLVNTSRSGYQFSAAVGMNPAGNYVIAWVSELGGSTEGVFAQRFNAAGLPQGAEFRVDDPAFVPFFNNRKRDPAIAMDADGNFIIVWTGGVLSFGDQFDYVFSSSEIYAQRYDPAGTPRGSNFLANTYYPGVQEQPSVGVDGPGNFVIAWVGPGTGALDIFAKRFDARGMPFGPFTCGHYGGTGFSEPCDFLVNSYTNGGQLRPAVALNPAEASCTFWPCAIILADFVVAWAGAGDGDNGGIFARGFEGSDGRPFGSDFRVNTYTSNPQEYPAVGMDEDGNFVVVWLGEGNGVNRGIFGQRFSPNGFPLGSEFPVATLLGSASHFTRLALGVGATGRFVVAWNDLEDATSAIDAIFARSFDATGAPQGAQVRVSDPSSLGYYRPAVKMDGGENFLIAWEGGSDGSFSGIYARRYFAPTLSIGNVTVAEGNSGTTNAIFTIILSPASTQTVSVTYGTTNGTATVADNDYTGVADNLMFLPGQVSKQIAVPVNGDTRHEPDELFFVVLSNPINAPIARRRGVGTILNDDPCPQPRLRASMNGSDCNLIFVAEIACTYHLEYKNSLTTTSWSALRTVAGNGGTITVTDTNVTSQSRARFYRAKVQ